MVISHIRLVQVVVLLALSVFFLSACASTPPREIDNICSIFKQEPGWYGDALDMQEKWRVPIPVTMAIIHQESRFVANAKPGRKYVFFGLIPWGRKSSAYGYSQALTGTWRVYKKETGNSGADRNDFADAIDFVGWYVDTTRRKNNVRADNAYTQYINYHEGWVGYRKGSHKNKKWLLITAKNVSNRADAYTSQYSKCKADLKPGFLYRLFTKAVTD